MKDPFFISISSNDSCEGSYLQLRDDIMSLRSKGIIQKIASTHCQNVVHGEATIG